MSLRKEPYLNRLQELTRLKQKQGNKVFQDRSKQSIWCFQGIHFSIY